MTNARRLAAQVVASVLQGQHSNAALSKAINLSDLSARDKGFCTELVYGTLRWAGPLELSLRRALDKPNQKIDAIIMPHLLVAAYQLQHLSDSIPPHAAVNEAVNEIKRIRRYLAGFANVVLKRLGSSPHMSASIDHLAEAFGLPDVLLTEIHSQLPKSEWIAACAAMKARPATWLRLFDPDDELAGAHAHPFVPQAVSLDKTGPITQLPGYAEGKLTVQDPASQIAALLLAPNSSSFVIDMCAAPGGKSMILKAAAPQGRVLAIDISAERLRSVTENATRLKLNVETQACDARELQFAADFVLLDAPCSGLGTLRRHPEIAFRDVSPQLADLQCELLDSAAKCLKSSGFLLYSVCSPLAAEGAEQINTFLERHPEFTRCNAADTLPWLPADAVNALGEVVLWPHRHACDAFFAARLQKR